MRKLYSLLTAGLLFSGFSTAQAIDLPEGEHTLTAKVEIMNSAKESFLTQYLGVPKTFTITGKELSNFLGNSMSSITLKFDSSTGVVTLSNGNLGTALDFDDFSSFGFGLANADGEYNATSVTTSWTVDAAGHITIPDFTIVNTNSGNAILAKYTNVKVDGWPEGDDDGDDDGNYPASVVGEYTFNADVTFPNSATYKDFEKYCPSNFDFEIASTYLDNFLNYNGYVYYAYDKDNGQITIQTNVLMTSTEWIPDGYMGLQFMLADENGTYTGFSRSGGDIMKWKAKADGSISIPDFTLIAYNISGYPIIAKYSNVVVTKKSGGEVEPDPEPGPAEGEYVPDNSDIDIEGAELIGKYKIFADSYKGILDLAYGYAKDEAITIEVEVLAAEGDADTALSYYIVETGEGNYLNGNIIPFSYNSGSNLAQFESFFAGRQGEAPIFFTPMLKPELQGTFGWTFTAENGFTFTGANGWCWIESKNDSGVDPADSFNAVSTYILTGCEPIIETNFPKAGEFDGNYKFECTDYELVSDTYAEYLPEIVYFEIKTTYNSATGAPSVYAQNFILESNLINYDEATGVGELNNVFGKPEGCNTYLYIAPEDGGYTAMSGSSANRLKVILDEDGNITIPNFDIIINPSTTKDVQAKYYNGTVTPISEDEVPKKPTDEKNWEGTYHFSGTRYDYIDGVESKSALEFDLVIDEKNRITAIAGVEVPEENLASGESVIENKNTLFEATQASYIVETSTKNGISWTLSEFSTEEQQYQDGFIFGSGSNLTEWVPNERAIYLTPNEDGETYHLDPFSIWEMTTVWDSEANSGDGGYVSQYELVFKWDDTPYAAPVEPIYPPEEVEGMWDFTQYDHYYGNSTQTVSYKAEIIGKEVTFTDVANGGDVTLFAQFIDETTIRFSKANTMPGQNIKFPAWQVPYIYTELTNNIDDLWDKYQVDYIDAEYDAEAGTLTFPENSGILISHLTVDGEFTSGEGWNVMQGYHATAFDLTAPAKKVSEIPAEITISVNPGWFTVNGNEIEITVDVELQGFSFPEVDQWKVNVNTYDASAAGDSDDDDAAWVPFATITDVKIEAGVATFTIGNLEIGKQYDFQFTLEAFDAEGNSIAVSNARALSTTVGGEIQLIYSTHTADKDAIEVQFRHTISGIDLDNADFKARFIEYETNGKSGNDYEETEISRHDVEVELDHDAKTGTARFENHNLTAGSYKHKVQLVAFDADGKEIAASNALSIDSTIEDDTTGIDGILGESAEGDTRYFNLQGVEIRNPKAGTIVIKVTDGKAQKVLIK